MQKRSPFSYIPGYNKNAVIQLIIACGTAYVLFHLTRAIMLIVGVTEGDFNATVTPHFTIYTLAAFKAKFWGLFTYGWLHRGFWELVTNMLWLYTFGNLVQVLVGYKQVIPIFLYSLLTGGIFFLLCQFIPGRAFQVAYPLMGVQAGLMGLMTAAVTLAPGYRFFLGDRLRISIWVVAGIFLLLMLMNTQLLLPQLFLLLGGGLVGFGYMLLLRKGYRPGAWIYEVSEKIGNTVRPDEDTLRDRRNKKIELEQKRIENENAISQKRIDEILDKINQRGYNSLTKEEKEILLRVGKEN